MAPTTFFQGAYNFTMDNPEFNTVTGNMHVDADADEDDDVGDDTQDSLPDSYLHVPPTSTPNVDARRGRNAAHTTVPPTPPPAKDYNWSAQSTQYTRGNARARPQPVPRVEELESESEWPPPLPQYRARGAHGASADPNAQRRRGVANPPRARVPNPPVWDNTTPDTVPASGYPSRNPNPYGGPQEVGDDTKSESDTDSDDDGSLYAYSGQSPGTQPYGVSALTLNPPSAPPARRGLSSNPSASSSRADPSSPARTCSTDAVDVSGSCDSRVERPSFALQGLNSLVDDLPKSELARVWTWEKDNSKKSKLARFRGALKKFFLMQ